MLESFSLAYKENQRQSRNKFSEILFNIPHNYKREVQEVEEKQIRNRNTGILKTAKLVTGNSQA